MLSGSVSRGDYFPEKIAAWSHVRAKNGGALKDKYLYMTKIQSKSKKIAIVAIARKLAELMYSLLKNTKKEPLFQLKNWQQMLLK